MAGIAEVRREMPVRLSRRGGHFVFTCICFFTPRISPLVALYERHRIFFLKNFKNSVLIRFKGQEKRGLEEGSAELYH